MGDYKAMLIELASKIRPDDLKSMLFALKGVIKKRESENIKTAIDLWDALEDREHLGPSNLEHLKNLLRLCMDGRTDGLRIVEDYEAKRDQHRPPLPFIELPNSQSPHLIYRQQPLAQPQPQIVYINYHVHPLSDPAQRTQNDFGRSVIESLCPRRGVVPPQPKPAASRSQMNIATTQEEKQVLIKGTPTHVFEAQNLFHKKLMDKARQDNEKRDAEQLYQVVQWQFEEVTEDGVNLVPYDELTNYRMEEAFKRGDIDLELKDPIKKKTYVVDFKKCIEFDKEDDEDKVKIVRKDILKDKVKSVPDFWMEMKSDENIRLVNIQNQDPEYTNLENTFITECKNGSYANRIPNLATMKVLKIQRIQNRTLYQQYAAKRQLMMQHYKDKPNIKVEWKAWHGTAEINVESIYTHGFNRSYCGKHGVWFGQGVYFATNASYSARAWLAAGNQAPPQGTKQFIFYVSVCVGEYIKGDPKMRYLPAKDPTKPTDVYDSAVNDVNNVEEIVIFNDTQAYPDYLITFTT